MAETNRYKNIQPSLGSQFSEAVARTLALALAFPQAGAPLDDGVRKLVVRRFPYNVVYQEVADGVMIIAIAHHAREPGYWVGRG